MWVPEWERFKLLRELVVVVDLDKQYSADDVRMNNEWSRRIMVPFVTGLFFA
jgi:uncharacterized protein involved in tellurium resistance